MSAVSFGPHHAGDGHGQQDRAPRELFAILRSHLGLTQSRRLRADGELPIQEAA
jgi:hypothetical protein